MKIEQITLHSYSLPYRQTVRWSDIEESHADYVLLRIVGDDGAVGHAEATAKPPTSKAICSIAGGVLMTSDKVEV